MHDKPSFSGARVGTKSHDFSYRYVHFNSFKSVKEEKEGRKEGRKKKERKKETKGDPLFSTSAEPLPPSKIILYCYCYCTVL